MDMMTDILAATERHHTEAVAMLAALRGGATLAPGMTPEGAIQILKENIETYERTLRRYGRLPRA